MADERTAEDGQDGVEGEGQGQEASRPESEQPRADESADQPGAEAENGESELEAAAPESSAEAEEPAASEESATPAASEDPGEAVAKASGLPVASEESAAAAVPDAPAAAEEPEAPDAPAATGVPEVPAVAGAPVASEETAPPGGESAAPQPQSDTGQELEDEDVEEDEPAPRVKPEVPGAHLEVDIVPEGADPFGREEPEDPYASYATDPYAAEDEQEGAAGQGVEDDLSPEPIQATAVDLAAGARYMATGKRKTAIARVILKPGDGKYLVNGRPLEGHVPRMALQRDVRQPLEAVGLQERMDVVARVHGGGGSSQAGALRHGIAKALIEADPNLRGELKQRGFLTRDARVKERKKAGLKKARKRPQFSKR